MDDGANGPGGARLCRAALCSLAVPFAFLLLAMPVRAQVADSLAAVADSLAVPADTLVAPVDSLGVLPSRSKTS